MDRAGALAPAQIARITFEILRPVPIAELTVSSRVERPGRSVELVAGALADGEGDVIRARAWRVRTNSLDITPPEPDAPPPGPDEASDEPFFSTGADTGYQSAMDVRFARGAFLDLGPATAWMRMRVPLVVGEETAPLERVLVAADSANGISAALDFRRFVFVNADLSVAIHRLPAGEWVCLESETIPQPTGVGISDTKLYDERGAIGRATQALLIARRGE
jgi:hypothetical protein